MTAVILFIILALWSAAEGDWSGVEGILSFVLWVGAIMLILALFAYYPQVIVLIVTVVFVIFLASS